MRNFVAVTKAPANPNRLKILEDATNQIHDRRKTPSRFADCPARRITPSEHPGRSAIG